MAEDYEIVPEVVRKGSRYAGDAVEIGRQVVRDLQQAMSPGFAAFGDDDIGRAFANGEGGEPGFLEFCESVQDGQSDYSDVTSVTEVALNDVATAAELAEQDSATRFS